MLKQNRVVRTSDHIPNMATIVVGSRTHLHRHRSRSCGELLAIVDVLSMFRSINETFWDDLQKRV